MNRIVGTKVSIVSSRPQTTRTQVRGVRTTPDSQIVLLDTPGIHKPRTLLGERCNERSVATLGEVDVVCQLIEANAVVGPGDRFIAELVGRVRTPRILVVNKVDIANRDEIGEQLARASGELGDFDAFVPISAAHRRGRRPAGRGDRHAGCPRGRTTTRTASSPISPRRRSSPSCSASSCSPSPATSCRTRSR